LIRKVMSPRSARIGAPTERRVRYADPVFVDQPAEKLAISRGSASRRVRKLEAQTP